MTLKIQWYRLVPRALLLAMSFLMILPPAQALADMPSAAMAPAAVIQPASTPAGTAVSDGQTTTMPTSAYQLPVNQVRVSKRVKILVTAYNATPEQTDESPCITADGTDVCNQSDIHIVAANWLPFGTKIRIPQYFGDTVFVVHDRMNARYDHRLDVLMANVTDAKQFGARYLEVEIL